MVIWAGDLNYRVGSAETMPVAEVNRRVDAGVFCKFSFDAVRAPRGESPWCATENGAAYDGPLNLGTTIPAEGAAALSRASSSRNLRNHSCLRQLAAVRR